MDRLIDVARYSVLLQYCQTTLGSGYETGVTGDMGGKAEWVGGKTTFDHHRNSLTWGVAESGQGIVVAFKNSKIDVRIASLSFDVYLTLEKRLMRRGWCHWMMPSTKSQIKLVVPLTTKSRHLRSSVD